MTATRTQTDKVLRLLLDRWEGITSLDAINELGCTRLAARISVGIPGAGGVRIEL